VFDFCYLAGYVFTLMVYVNVVLFSFSKALGSSGIPFGSFLEPLKTLKDNR